MRLTLSEKRNGWKEFRIQDIALSMADAPFGSGLKTEDYQNDGVPVIQGKNIQGRKCKWIDIRFVSQEKFRSLKRHEAKVGGLVFPKVGTIGKVGILTPFRDKKEYILSTNTMMLEPNPSIAINDFVYYYFSSSEVSNHIQSINANSVQPVFNFTSLKNYYIALPSMPEQKAIAAVLSSLDDKIDLLHRQNQTLEALAETLFRQWFVEEAHGDWKTGLLQDLISIKGGTTPSTKEPEYWDGNIHWTSPRDLSNHNSVFLFDTERKITEKGLAQIGSGLLPAGTVLLSSRAPIGYLAITDIQVAINQGYIAIVCDKYLSNYFMYLWCKANMEEIENAGNGSVFQEISKSTFKALEMQIPPKGLLYSFEKSVSSTFEKVKANQKQIQTLEKLRDTLLPKLMSGEVRVAI